MDSETILVVYLMAFSCYRYLFSYYSVCGIERLEMSGKFSNKFVIYRMDIRKQWTALKVTSLTIKLVCNIG